MTTNPSIQRNICQTGQVASYVGEVIRQKRDQVIAEIGLPKDMNLFADKKALPVFLAFS